MKKIVLLLSVVIFCISNSYANSSSSDNGFDNPYFDKNFTLKAELSGDKVYLSWNKYVAPDTIFPDDGTLVERSYYDKFLYYKIIKSQDVVNPVYPDNGYISAISNIDETKFIDYKLTSGTNYYRVCTILTTIVSTKARICSNVVKIFVEKKENPVACTMDYNPVCGKLNGSEKTFSNKCILNSSNATYLYSGECKKQEITSPIACTMEAKMCSDGSYVGRSGPNCEFQKCPEKLTGTINNTLQLKSDKIIDQLFEKIEKNYSDNNKKITVLNIVIEKLNKLGNTKPNQKQLIEYIVSKLKAKIDTYKGDDLGDIESIFNEIQ